MRHCAIILLVLFYLITCNRLIALEAKGEHRQGSGIGYRDHYSKIAIYHAFEKNWFQPFIDLRYLILNDGKQGGNLGGGIGIQFPKQNRLSLYSYFDLTQSQTGHLFNQMMAGIAYTHPIVFSKKDFGEFTSYLNGYFPMKSLEKAVSSPTFSRFKGNNLLINETNRFALTGMNIELGYLSNTWHNWNLYVALSPYYFKRSNLHAFGGYGKLRLIYNDLISTELFVSRDRLFKTTVSGTIGLRIPLGKRGMQRVKRRIYSPHQSRPIERLEPIVLKRGVRELKAKNTLGNPLYFLFVNNMNGSVGTFEDPFAKLSDAENISSRGDFIYVFSGDGTTNGMADGLLMKVGQTLMGSGTPFTVSTKQGLVTIPPLTPNQPTITNALGDGITLVDNCVVNGITVRSSSGNGFSYTSSSDSATATLSHCSSMDNDLSGFFIRSTSSDQMTFSLSHCSARENILNGFSISAATSASIKGLITNCVANTNSGIGFSIGGTGVIANLTFIHSVANENSANGVFSSINGSSSSTPFLSFSSCSASNNQSAGFQSSNLAGTVNSLFSNCAASQNGFSGFDITTTNLTTSTLIGCTAIGNQSGFDITSTGSGAITEVTFSECTSNGNTEDGFQITDGLVSGTTTAFLSNCLSTSDAVNGFFVKYNQISSGGALENCSAIGTGSSNTFNINTSLETFSTQEDLTLSLDL